MLLVYPPRRKHSRASIGFNPFPSVRSTYNVQNRVRSASNLLLTVLSGAARELAAVGARRVAMINFELCLNRLGVGEFKYFFKFVNIAFHELIIEG